MRILLTADPELPVPPVHYGGIERVVDLLIRELRSEGHSVGLVAHRNSSVESDAFFAWPGVRSQSQTDTLKNTVALWGAVRDFKPEVLHSFSRLAYLFPLLVRGRCLGSGGLRILMSYQRQPTMRQVHRAAQWGGDYLRFTGCSEHICREGKLGGGVWHAIHNCVEMSRYTYCSEVASDAPLVFLSRIERIKGAHAAIQIARRAGRRLIIAGNHAMCGSEAQYWEKEILPNLGRGGIEYVGPVDDTQKNALLGRAAAMVVPIEWDEPFGIVFAESLACGTPVISCARGALPEIVRHGVEGFLVNGVGDGVEAVAQLSKIRREDCRLRAEQEFSSRVIMKRYLDVYSDVRPKRE